MCGSQISLNKPSLLEKVPVAEAGIFFAGELPLPAALRIFAL